MGVERRSARAPVAGAPDAVLIARTRAGDERAYAELYERHAPAARATAWSLLHSQQDVDDVTAEAFARVFAILRAGRGPDEAFRPYLLTCVRRGCVDRGVRTQRLLPVDPQLMAERPSNRDDEVERRAESELMASAFTTLPVRWRQVLWLTEVERRSHGEVGARLGLAPAAVAALALRARQGLSAAYLRAHLGPRADRECRAVAERLPAFVRGTASASDQRRVAAHLAQCPSCRAAELELHDLNVSLRSLPVAALVGVATAAAARRGVIARLLERLGWWHPRAKGRGASGTATSTASSAGTVGCAVGNAAMVTAGGVGTGFLTTIGAVAALIVVPSMALTNSEGHSSAPTPVTASAKPTSPATGVPASGTGTLGRTSPAGGATTRTAPSGGAPGLGDGVIANAVGGTAGGPAAVDAPSLDIPGLDIPALASPAIATPQLTTPALAVPAVTTPGLATAPINVPPITLPPITPAPIVPPIDLPGPLPPVTLPPVTVPPVTVPPVTVPSITVPSITVPSVIVPAVTLPPVTLPPVTVPPIGLP